MATTIGTFKINGSDAGNLPNYADMYIYKDTNLFASSGSGGLNPGSITDILNQYVYFVEQSGGTMTYTLDGPDTWHTFTDTTVTITISNVLPMGGPELIPYYLFFTTEDFNYPVVWRTAEPVTPRLCNDCQFIQLTQCGTDNFYLNLGLPDGSYTTYWADNTSGVMWEQGTYSGEGGLSVYQWSATAGMFNTYSFYTLTIKDSTGAPVSWTVDGVEYTCATVTFKTTVNVTD